MGLMEMMFKKFLTSIKIKGNFIEISFKNYQDGFPIATIIGELSLHIDNIPVYDIDSNERAFYIRLNGSIYPKEKIKEILDTQLGKNQQYSIIVQNGNGFKEGKHELMVTNKSEKKSFKLSYKLEISNEPLIL